MRSYLFDDKTTLEEKLTLFKWRTSMEKNFGENFRGGRGSIPCPFCLSHVDSQEEVFSQCKFIRDNIEIGKGYEKLYGEDINANFTQTLSIISELKSS